MIMHDHAQWQGWSKPDGVPSPICCTHVYHGRPGGVFQPETGRLLAFLCDCSCCGTMTRDGGILACYMAKERDLISSRPVLEPPSGFHIWWNQRIRSICRWHRRWIDSSLGHSEEVQVSEPWSKTGSTQVWKSLMLVVSRMKTDGWCQSYTMWKWQFSWKALAIF